MKLEAKREQLLKPLQHVIGAVERRQTLPILTNVLVSARERELTLTTTDLEMELSVRVELQVETPGETTLPARRLHDILRALPDDASVTLSVEGDKATVRCGRSRFTLITLPAGDFPTLEDLPFEGDIRLPQGILRSLIERTHFAMAQQDVRYYLNGLLIETDGKHLRAVATDGHRLAICECGLEGTAKNAQQVIVPRKGVLELQRLLGSEGMLDLAIGTNHIRAQIGDVRFTSKLIDGRFPEYGRVIPATPTRVVEGDRDLLRQALQRTAILSNEKYRGVRLTVKPDLLTVQAHNPEQEEAEDQVEVNYQGEEVEIGFNVNYLLDALAAIDGEKVQIGLGDANSSCLIRADSGASARYVVMPMRL